MCINIYLKSSTTIYIISGTKIYLCINLYKEFNYIFFFLRGTTIYLISSTKIYYMNIRYDQSSHLTLDKRSICSGLIDESEMRDGDFLWCTKTMGNCVRRQGKMYCFFLVINGTLMYLCTPYISHFFC